MIALFAALLIAQATPATDTYGTIIPAHIYQCLDDLRNVDADKDDIIDALTLALQDEALGKNWAAVADTHRVIQYQKNELRDIAIFNKCMRGME